MRRPRRRRGADPPAKGSQSQLSTRRPSMGSNSRRLLGHQNQPLAPRMAPDHHVVGARPPARPFELGADPGVAVSVQRGEDRREAKPALAWGAAVGIVQVDVGDVTGWQPALDQLRDRRGFALARGAAVDHGADRRRADLVDDCSGLLDPVDQRGLRRRQRLDAIGDARLPGIFGDRRETFSGVGERLISGLAPRNQPLPWRTVDQDRPAEIGAEPDQGPHHFERTHADCAVRAGDREPLGDR